MDVKLLTLLAALTAVMYAPPSQGMTLFSDLLCVLLAQVYLDFFFSFFFFLCFCGFQCKLNFFLQGIPILGYSVTISLDGWR